MPDSYDLLIRLLTFTPHRVSAAGKITLTVAEAQARLSDRRRGLLEDCATAGLDCPLLSAVRSVAARFPPAQTAVIASPQASGEA